MGGKKRLKKKVEDMAYRRDLTFTESQSPYQEPDTI